jgi:hypothetical protein
MSTNICCFISPHGFGHATRTIAVLEELHKLVPDLHAHLFSTVPESLFTPISLPYSYTQITTDIGLTQATALSVSMSRTVRALESLTPFAPDIVTRCARECETSRLIICDISVLGIIIGKKLGIPSVLVENFTWDWIYSRFSESAPALARFSDYFAKLYEQADYHVQTEPVCRPVPCDLTSYPVSRSIKSSAAETRAALGGRDRRIVLITMGGVPHELPFISQLNKYPEYLFVLAGQINKRTYGGNILMLSGESNFHHPDLINAAHLLVCKTGYSTIAECAQTATPVCAVSRSNFAESAVLERFIRHQLHGTILEQDEFNSGRWLDELPHLQTSRSRPRQNGAAQIASFLARLL